METRNSLAYTDVASIATGGTATVPIVTRATGSNTVRVRNNGTVGLFVWAFDTAMTAAPTAAQVIARGDYLGPDESIRFSVGGLRQFAFAARVAGATAFVEEEQTVVV